LGFTSQVLLKSSIDFIGGISHAGHFIEEITHQPITHRMAQGFEYRAVLCNKRSFTTPGLNNALARQFQVYTRDCVVINKELQPCVYQ
jgi:hypothetical protein